MDAGPFLLIGCGILAREVRFLIDRNHWPMEAIFFDSSLHCYLDRLAQGLTGLLEKKRGRRIIVFYGCCHPRLDEMVTAAGAVRTEGQNCLEMLLGREPFMAELSAGAYFLLEAWARTWEPVLTRTFGTRKIEIIREMFQGDRKYLLGLRTPCSGDFRDEAEKAGELVGLPLRWRDAPLDHLESVLRNTMSRLVPES